MRKLRHFTLLLLSLLFWLSACGGEVLTKASAAQVAVGEINEGEVEEQQRMTTMSILTIKTEAIDRGQIRSPLLDVPIDNIVNGDAFSPRLPYIFPRFGGAGSASQSSNQEDQAASEMHMLMHWNQVAIDASGRDHETITTLAMMFSEGREQLGPGRASRALAIVHIAIFEAINAIHGGYKSYVGLPRVTANTDVRAAIAVAAEDTLSAMFKAQEAIFLAEQIQDLKTIPDSIAKQRGIELGHAAAAAILALREDDGSEHSEPIVGVDFITSNEPGKWRKDPISNIPVALGAYWDEVVPFVLTSADQFRLPPPPDISSPEYAIVFNEVKNFGGDGINTPTSRNDEQTEIAIFWAYDGVPNLCAPPRLYNQIVRKIAEQEETDMVHTARLFALINVAMADAAISIWDAKYHYQYWRPVTGIREADAGTGPSLIGDNNPLTKGDSDFYPLGAPASNISNGIDFTPPFPAYPSGHAGFGGAIFQILRKFYGKDEIEFTFISDELNGITKDSDGITRPLRPRTFTSLSQAEEENGQSRIYLGIHWQFDKTGGITLGNQIADYIWDHLFMPQS